MQKFVLKSSAALMLAGIAGQAFAAAGVADTFGVAGGVNTYAQELSSGGQAIGTGINVLGDIGFGVSAGQTRFVRYDLTNATFQNAVAAGDLTTDPATAAANITVVQGGTAGSSFVIFQITADGVGLAQLDDVAFALDNPNILVTTVAPVTLRYRLYETAGDAANQAAGPLSSASATIANFATGISFTSTPNTTTAEVATSYKNFSADATLLSDGFISATQANVGNVSFGAAAGVLRPVDGLQVTLADLIQAPVTFTVTGADFGSSTGVFVDNDGDLVECNTSSFAPTTSTATTRVFTIGVTTLTNANVCYNVAPAPNALPQIAAQSFGGAIDLSAAAGATTVDPAGVNVGSFIQNGTVLKVPYLFSNRSGLVTFVHLSNNSSIAAPYTVTCLSNGAASAAGTPGTVPANRSLSLDRAAIGCPASSNTAIFTINSARGNVIGTMVRTNGSTGESGFDTAVGSE